MQALGSREEGDRRARERREKPGEGIGRGGSFIHSKLAVGANVQLGCDRRIGAGGIYVLKRLGRWRRSRRRRRKSAPNGIAECPDLRQVGNREGAVAEALPFCGEPAKDRPAAPRRTEPRQLTPVAAWHRSNEICHYKR